jgi:hypothetical protein
VDSFYCFCNPTIILANATSFSFLRIFVFFKYILPF